MKSHFPTTLACMMIFHTLNAAEPITIAVTDQVVVEDVLPFGINVGTSDSYWNHQLRRQLVEENFEGTLYREVLQFTRRHGRILIERHRRTPDDPGVYVGGQFEVVSGEARGVRGLITSVAPAEGRAFAVTLDPAIYAEDGAILITHALAEGAIEPSAGVRLGEGAEYVMESDPNTFGSFSVRLDHAKEDAIIRAFPGAQGRMDMNIDWRLRFRHKADGDSAKLRVHTEGRGEEVSVEATKDWQQFDAVVPVREMTEVQDDLNYLRFVFEPMDGSVLIDDIELIRTDAENPTPFRDETIAAFQAANIGMIRALQGSHQTVQNTIRPRLQSLLGGGNRFSLHEFYQFAEAIGAIPWFSLPSTLTQQEMTGFMEYLGAPANVGWGRLRAELGHPTPWTESLSGIVIEFGNELYNFGGFGGPDYWHGLIETGKASPFYDSKVRFIMGHQGEALTHAQNMDGYAVGGYVCWGFTQDDYTQFLDSTPRLFEWAIANAMAELVDPDSGLASDHAAAGALGVELAMYEGGYHTNFGNGPNTPRNQLVTSVGGAVVYLNRMLSMLKKYGVRLQGYFATIGHGIEFKGTGAFGSEEAGFVRIWGSILNLDEGSERFRPAWLALSLVNATMLPEMVRTRQSGPVPQLHYTGPVRNLREARNNLAITATTLPPIPLIQRNGFRAGNRHSLLLINLDPRQAHEVRIELPGKDEASTATRMQLAGESISDHNEPDWTNSPEVKLQWEAIDFVSGYSLTLPPLSMTALIWSEGDPR